MKKRNLLFKIKFSGINYHGWQIQKNAFTVQEIFQNSVIKVIGKCPDIKACSRTDAGVHANMFCINMLLEHKISRNDFLMALNRVLPSDVVVYGCKEVPVDFHARYSCIAKEYIYKILNTKIKDPFLDGYVLHYWRELDIKKLQEAANFFVGTHDFSSFCTFDSRKRGDFTRKVEYFEVEKNNDMVIMRIKADGFLYNMARIMIGTLLEVANDRLKSKDIVKIIFSKNRKFAGKTVEPYGLYLNKVFYK